MPPPVYTPDQPLTEPVYITVQNSGDIFIEDQPTTLANLVDDVCARAIAGKLPAMLYAVGVLEISLSGSGQIQRLNWMRKPNHAPEVVREIERLVRAAAPFPSTGVGSVSYTDTWLWDRSGRFQLDTLTEGQLPGG